MKHGNVAIFIPHQGCVHACSFCNQRQISGRLEPPTVAQVQATLEQAKENLGERVQSTGIAFFGGSFTALPRDILCGYLEAAQPYLGKNGFAGIRVSTRPDAVDEEVLRILKDFGVTAIELGAQSMDNRVLEKNKRGHRAEDTVRAARQIRAYGFSLGLQMMTGLPGDSDEGAVETARHLAELEPDTVRIYPTLVLDHTALADWWRAGEYQPQTLEQAVRLCSELLAFFHENDIFVIRLGLHDEPTLTLSCLAGPYHPAFRELCESRILLDKTIWLLKERQIPPGTVRLYVQPGSQSKMAGQKRRNLLELEEMGYPAKILTDPVLSYLEVRVGLGTT